ncbi:hypothetical protein BD413DRAFT_517690 [Trametes elegans]|nr:hypothetical protein BD413DRAFT_517690 [Trametes elegans]
MLQLQTDHFAPHSSCKFEGYYTRAVLEDGATLAVIFCWVKGAKGRGNLVLVLYNRPDDDGHDAQDPNERPIPSFKYEFFPDRFDVSVGAHSRGEPRAFTITAPGLGSMAVSAHTIAYDIAVPAHDLRLRLALALTRRTAWSRTDPLGGPMGALLLPLSALLPLNWHVRATAAAAACELAHAGRTVRGAARAHAEKNWGASFPGGWIWAQACPAPAPAPEPSPAAGPGGRTLCLAGGEALPGVQAYLVGYRSPAVGAWDFRPPWTLGIGPLAPFLRVVRDSRRGTVDVRVETWFRRLRVRIAAPPGSFVGVAAPLEDGHKLDFAHESFRAKVEVEAWQRRWPWAEWELVEKGVLGQTADGAYCGALEFGGSFSHEARM